MSHFKHEFEKGNEFQMLRSLKKVQRLSGKPLIQKYSVAEHCYYTGILFEYFAKLENIHTLPEHVRYVYRHDILEAVTGDMLRPAKHFNENVFMYWGSIERELSAAFGIEHYRDDYVAIIFPEEIIKLFHACDVLELTMFCAEEIDLGNNTEAIFVVFNKCISYLEDCGFNSIVEYGQNKKWM